MEVQSTTKVEANVPAQTVQLDANPPSKEVLETAEQHKINLIWEYTQAIVAIMVVLSNMIVGVYQSLVPNATQTFPAILSSSLFLVVGFYFSRTFTSTKNNNHNNNNKNSNGTNPNQSNSNFNGR